MDESDGSGRRDGSLRWSVEQRVAFAAQRLYWDGSINREDLLRRFGVSINQATTDLARLRHANPNAIFYDTAARQYRTTEGFRPSEASAAALLRELRLLAEGYLEPSASVLANPPPIALAETPERMVDPDVLRVVLAAIRQREAIHGAYVSFQRPGEQQRILSPHALVFDGFRWHVRAHDAGDGRFKDFVIARLSRVSVAGAWREPPENDAQWHTIRQLEVIPHPGLSKHQRAVVARDYAMDVDQILRLTVRDAVVFYVCRRLGLVAGHELRDPSEQHIVLKQTQ